VIEICPERWFAQPDTTGAPSVLYASACRPSAGLDHIFEKSRKTQTGNTERFDENQFSRGDVRHQGQESAPNAFRDIYRRAGTGHRRKIIWFVRRGSTDTGRLSRLAL